MIRKPLVRDIAIVLAVKLAILIAASQFVFEPSRMVVTATTIEAHLFNPVGEKIP